MKDLEEIKNLSPEKKKLALGILKFGFKVHEETKQKIVGLLKEFEKWNPTENPFTMEVSKNGEYVLVKQFLKEIDKI